MPNWCYGFVTIKGKSKDIENFCKLFVFDGEQENKQKPYFARSFANTTWRDFKKDNLGKSKAEFGIDFAWSVYSCLIDGYPQGSKGDCITLKDACKKYRVDVKIESEEEGIGFEEKITCDRTGHLTNDCFDMPLYKCKKCGATSNFPSSYGKEELKEQECSDCEDYTKWKLVNKKEVS